MWRIKFGEDKEFGEDYVEDLAGSRDIVEVSNMEIDSTPRDQEKGYEGEFQVQNLSLTI